MIIPVGHWGQYKYSYCCLGGLILERRYSLSEPLTPTFLHCTLRRVRLVLELGYKVLQPTSGPILDANVAVLNSKSRPPPCFGSMIRVDALDDRQDLPLEDQLASIDKARQTLKKQWVYGLFTVFWGYISVSMCELFRISPHKGEFLGVCIMAGLGGSLVEEFYTIVFRLDSA